uniref:Uncharacterized protein n=1 Tax=Eptatretus burgeri TaxID=7764 RepID=A0A8C4QC37_EPTBU
MMNVFTNQQTMDKNWKEESARLDGNILIPRLLVLWFVREYMDIRKFFATASSRTSPTTLLEQSSSQKEVDYSKEKIAEKGACVSIWPNFPDQPFQPHDVSCIPVQILPNRKLKFQQQWFKDFPWLHFDQSIGRVLCHTCTDAFREKLTKLARCAEDAFVSKGFRNWKKATEKFRQHERSNTHRLASETY